MNFCLSFQKRIHPEKNLLAKLNFIVGFFFLIPSITFCQGFDKEISITHKDQQRKLLIHFPPSFSQGLPLVIVLHGGGGNKENVNKVTNFSAVADSENFLVAYPDGIDNQWNDGREYKTLFKKQSDADDVGFISSMIDYLIEKYNVDSNSVFVCGISNGGMMSLRIACQLAGKINSAASVAANMTPFLINNCSPIKPVSIMFICGTKDPLVPYYGGKVGLGILKNRGTVFSVEKSVDYWIKLNKCNPLPIVIEEDDNKFDKTKAIKKIFSDGLNGSEVILYTIENGGHTWPGGLQYLSERTIGKLSKDINASEVIWKFFKSHINN